MVATGTNRRIERWIWILIYGGMVFVAIGTGLLTNGHAFGWAVGALGAIDIVIGLVLIWVRARRPPDPARLPEPSP